MTQDPKAAKKTKLGLVSRELLPHREDGDDTMPTINALNGLPDEPTIDQAIQRHLGRKLKASYDELIKQPVPDKFRQLLEDLERKETKQ